MYILAGRKKDRKYTVDQHKHPQNMCGKKLEEVLIDKTLV
jgi:hypothetical protein